VSGFFFGGYMSYAKYRNVKVAVDGITFHSRKEANRYLELKLLVRAGEITDLELQKKYPMMVNGVKVCEYWSDFAYKDRTGQDVTEDVKSPITRKEPVYRLKNKLFKACYGREIREV
jgi:hypothetical protein